MLFSLPFWKAVQGLLYLQAQIIWLWISQEEHKYNLFFFKALAYCTIKMQWQTDNLETVLTDRLLSFRNPRSAPCSMIPLLTGSSSTKFNPRQGMASMLYRKDHRFWTRSLSTEINPFSFLISLIFNY